MLAKVMVAKVMIARSAAGRTDWKLFRIPLIGILAVALTACGGGGGTPTSTGTGGAGGTEADGGPGETEPEATTVAPVQGTATVTGKITLKGAAPGMPSLLGQMIAHQDCMKAHSEDNPPRAEDVVTGPGGGLANVFVYVSKGLEGKRFPRPKEAVKFDQKGCIYTPHVFGIQVGQELQITNSDPTLHNVHTLPKTQREYNSAHPKGSIVLRTKFTKPEVMVRIKCDVHPWMSAWAGVLPHPFFAVTKPDGTYEFAEKLPPGKYTITAWQEKYGEKQQEITVAAGDDKKEVSFEYEAK